MPVNLDWVSQIAQPVKPVDPLQLQMQAINLQNAQLQQQEMLQNIAAKRQAADDAKAIEALADQFELNPDGTFTDASIQKVYNLTPAKYLKTIRDVVDNHQKSAFALNKERNDAKQKYIQGAAKDVAAFADDPAAQSTMFLTKLGLMKKSGVITDNEVQQALQLVVSPDRTGDTPITGAINPNRLNMQLNAWMGPEEAKKVADARTAQMTKLNAPEEYLVDGVKTLLMRDDYGNFKLPNGQPVDVTGKKIEKYEKPVQPTSGELESRYIEIISKGNAATPAEKAWARGYEQSRALGRGPEAPPPNEDTMQGYIDQLASGTMHINSIPETVRNAVIERLHKSGVDITQLSSMNAQRAEMAHAWLPTVAKLKELASQINEKKLFGVIGGRLRDIYSTGSLLNIPLPSDLSPEDKKLLGNFATTAGLLKSGVATVHGGTRGGGSIGMLKQLDPYLAPEAKDFYVYMGNLEGMEDVLKKYEQMKPLGQSKLSAEELIKRYGGGGE